MSQILKYESGMLRIIEPKESPICSELDPCNFCGKVHSALLDNGTVFMEPQDADSGEWIIGGREEIELLIADLYRALDGKLGVR